MPLLIKDGAIVPDGWHFLEPEGETPGETKAEASAEAGILPAGPVIVPLAYWLERGKELLPEVERIGVWLNGDEDVSQLANHAPALPLIAVNFPVFTDGRGFSAGRLLRERHGFTGELRATGYILQDQLCYLRRCGFNAFSLPDHIDGQSALASLHDFVEYYQGAVDQPLPLFRRRAG